MAFTHAYKGVVLCHILIGVKRTQILGMGCSTLKLALGQGSLTCRFNGRILLVILLPCDAAAVTALDSSDFLGLQRRRVPCKYPTSTLVARRASVVVTISVRIWYEITMAPLYRPRSIYHMLSGVKSRGGAAS